MAETTRLDAAIYAAMDNRELRIHYQPKRSVATGAIVGSEALIRWHTPSQGVLLPASFLFNLAPETLKAVDQYVVNEALLQQMAWELAGIECPVSINLEAISLIDTAFIDSLLDTLCCFSGNMSHVEFEVTERGPNQALETICEALARIKGVGVTLSLDDFGTGNNARLERITALPVDTVKIDKSQIHAATKRMSRLSGLLDICHWISGQNKSLVGEGIESETHLKIARHAGMQVGQGYYLGRPVEVGELERLIHLKHPWRCARASFEPDCVSRKRGRLKNNYVCPLCETIKKQ